MPAKKIDWKAKLDKIKKNMANVGPNTTIGEVMAPATVVVNLNERHEFFDRIGFLRHSKPRIFISENPCKTLVTPNGNTKATINLSEETVRRLSKTWSQQASRGIQKGISAKLTGTIGGDLTGKVSAETSAQLTASKGMSSTASKTIEESIKTSISVKSEVAIDAEAPICYTLEVPYGMALTTTVRGTITYIRAIKLAMAPGGGMTATGWSERGSTVLVAINVDISVSAKINDSMLTITKARCDTCAGEENPHKTTSTAPGGTQDSSGNSGKPSRKLKTRRRKPRWVSYHAERDLAEVQGLGVAAIGKLSEVGIKNVGALALTELSARRIGISEDDLINWRSQATWLASFGELDGNDAQVLAEGLGFDDVDHLEIYPLPNDAQLVSAMSRVVVPKDYDGMRIRELLLKCPAHPS